MGLTCKRAGESDLQDILRFFDEGILFEDMDVDQKAKGKGRHGTEKSLSVAEEELNDQDFAAEVSRIIANQVCSLCLASYWSQEQYIPLV
jgi:hypothetical protein